jgi:adenosylhomocysteine nucleosidase
MKIAIIAAMDKEVKLMQSLASENVSIFKSGIGKVAAAIASAQIILEHHPDLIINSGVAGGLDSSLNIGDTVCAKAVCYHDVWCGEPNAYGQVQGFPLFYKSAENITALLDANIKKGLIISGDKFITAPEELSLLKGKFPKALAVDMESAAIAQTAFMLNTPFISLRLISDTPGVKHHQEQYDNFWRNAAESSFNNLKALLNSINLRNEN